MSTTSKMLSTSNRTHIHTHTQSSRSKNKDVSEMNTIKYKMMTSGLPSAAANQDLITANSFEEMTNFLNDESSGKRPDPWNKLSKTLKYKKIKEYVHSYNQENDLTEDDTDKLLVFLSDCLNKKKLHKVKDVEYDKTTGCVVRIPLLVHNKTEASFSLKPSEKRKPHLTTIKVSTQSSEDDLANISLSDTSAEVV